MTSAMQRTVPQSASNAEAAAALRTAIVFGVGPCILVAALVAVFAAELGPLLNVAARDRDLVTPAIRIFVWALPLWAFVEIATSALRARMVFGAEIRSEEHTSELQSLMRISSAVFCLKKNNKIHN